MSGVTITHELWLLVFCTFGLLAQLGATSGVVNQLLWVSEPLACVLAGIALGPLGAGLLHLDPVASTLDADILREAARFTLAIAVTGACLPSGCGGTGAVWRRQMLE